MRPSADGRHARPSAGIARALAVAIVIALAAGCDTGAPSGPTGALATPLALDTAPIAEVIAALGDADAGIRLEAAQSLGKRADASAVPALVRAIEDADPDVRVAAVEALGAIGDPTAVEPLLAVVKTQPEVTVENGELRYTAALTALGRIGGTAAIQRLLELEADTVSLVVLGAVSAVTDALEALDAADVPALTAALKHADEDVRLEAIDRLGAIGGPAVDVLLGQLGSKVAAIKAAAVEALGVAGDARATAALVKALADSKVTSAASRALATIHERDATPLLKYLKAKGTVGVYLPLMRIGQSGTESAMITALTKFGGVSMAEDYLNCGNAKLESAARSWGKRHGYTIVTRPGVSVQVAWGG